MVEFTVGAQALSASVADLGQPFNSLIFAVILIGGSVILLLLAAMGLSLAGRRKMLTRGRMSKDELQAWRADIVRVVGEASQTQGAHVPLRRYWRGSGLTTANKFVILEDLLKRQVFYRAYSNDTVVSFFQQLSWDWLNRPVSWVRLSEQNWMKLATGTSARIVAGNDVIVIDGSPGAGVQKNSPNATQTITAVDDPSTATRVAKALREDAKALVEDSELRLRAENYALELEAHADRSDRENVRATLANVLAFASNSAGLWASTLAILGSR